MEHANNDRKIDINLNLSEFDQEILKGNHYPPTPCPVFNALGYLVQYGMHDEFIFDTLSIYARDKGHEIIAYYTDSKSKASFVMGAIWRKDEKIYSFHS